MMKEVKFSVLKEFDESNRWASPYWDLAMDGVKVVLVAKPPKGVIAKWEIYAKLDDVIVESFHDL